jgi:hypothetical protein
MDIATAARLRLFMDGSVGRVIFWLLGSLILCSALFIFLVLSLLGCINSNKVRVPCIIDSSEWI